MSTQDVANIDSKLVSRPTVFDGKHESWSDWKFLMINYAGSVWPQYVDYMEQAEARDYAVVPSDSADLLSRARNLFTLLVGFFLMKSKPMQMAKRLTSRQGFELWRLLNLEYEPKIGARMLVRFRKLMSPNLSIQEDEFEETLLE